MGSLKRSAEGERNRGNTVRKGEKLYFILFFRNAGVSGKRGALYLEELRRTLFLWNIPQLIINNY